MIRSRPFGRTTQRVGAGAGAGLLVLLLLLTPWPVLALVPLLLLAGAVMPPEWGVVGRLLGGGIVLAATLAAVCVVPGSARPLMLLPLAAAACAALAVSELADLRAVRVGWSDAVLVAAAGPLATAFFDAWRRRTPGGRLGVMLSGEDNSAHLALVTATRAAHGYLYWGHDPEISSDLRNYPHGAHVVTALLGRALAPHADAVTQVDTYTIGLLTGVVALCGALVLVTLRLMAAAGASSRWSAIGAGVAVVAVTGPLLALVQNGFFSQIWAYVLLLAMVGVAVDRAAAARPWFQLLCVGVLGVGVALTFYFLLPVAAACATPVVIRQRGTLLRARAMLLPLAALVVAGLVPVLKSLGSGAAGSINAPGPIFPLDRGTLFVTAAAAVLLVPLCVGLADRWGVAAWAASFAAAAGFALALRQLQLHETGGTGYYYEKSLYTVFVLALPAVGAAVGVALHSRLDAFPWRQVAAAAVAGAAAAATAAQVLTTPKPAFLEHQLRAAQTQRALDQVLREHPHETSDPVLVWSYSSPTDDYISNRVLGGVYHQDDQARRDLVLAQARGADGRDVLPPYLTAHPGSSVYSKDGALLDALRTELAPAALERVHLELVP